MNSFCFGSISYFLSSLLRGPICGDFVNHITTSAFWARMLDARFWTHVESVIDRQNEKEVSFPADCAHIERRASWSPGRDSLKYLCSIDFHCSRGDFILCHASVFVKLCANVSIMICFVVAAMANKQPILTTLLWVIVIIIFCYVIIIITNFIIITIIIITIIIITVIWY